MANTKNYTEHGGSVTHIGGELVLDPGSKIIKDGQEIDIGGSLPPVEGSGKALVSVNGEWKEQDGYGYTEKGDQTVIVDNERVTTVDAGGMNYNRFTTPFDIVDGAYTVIFNGTEYNLNSTLNEEFGIYIIGETTETGFDFSRYPFAISNTEGIAILVTESAGDYEITVKTESEIIHKISDKFYDSTVEFTIDQRDEESEPVYLIYHKCFAAVNRGKNVRLRIIDEYDFETSYIFSDIDNPNQTISFVNVCNSTDGIVFKLAVIGINGSLTTKTKLLS